MSKYERTFCSQCGDYTVHEKGECLRHSKCEAEREFETKREEWRRWLAGLSFCQLMDVSRDVMRKLEYEAAKIEEWKR